MKFKVLTYGNVAHRDVDFITNAYKGVARNMEKLPRKCNLHICKTKEDLANSRIGVDERFFEKKKMHYVPKKEEYEIDHGFITTLLLKYPDTFVLENDVRQVKCLEELEGHIAHEVGHVADLFRRKRSMYSPYATPIGNCIKESKDEYEAERRAIDADYYSELMTRKVRYLRYELPLTADSIFFSLKLMSLDAALRQSERVPECQKRLNEDIWQKFCGDNNDSIKRMLQSEELKLHPERFGSEDFLWSFLMSNLNACRKELSNDFKF